MDFLAKLDPDFKAKLIELQGSLKEEGFDVRPYCGIRHPIDQAKEWRKSRSTEEIVTKIAWLRARKAPHLAACLEKAGPQYGKPTTKSLPGFSWHQWGEACDFMVIGVNGKAQWFAESPAYIALATKARLMGLKPGRDFGDPPHIQKREIELPRLFTPEVVDKEMLTRYPDLASLI